MEMQNIYGRNHGKGFTVVELLAVIVVIGILAAISTIAYGKMSSRGNESLVQADLRANIMRVNQYIAVKDVYPPNAVPLDTQEARDNDWRMKISKKSAYDGLYFCSMHQNWGHPQQGVVLLAITKQQKHYVVNSDDAVVKDVTDQVTPESDLRAKCNLGVRSGLMTLGIDGLVYPSGATQRVTVVAQ